MVITIKEGYCANGPEITCHNASERFNPVKKVQKEVISQMEKEDMMFEIVGVNVEKLLQRYSKEYNHNGRKDIEIENTKYKEINVTSLLHESSNKYTSWLDPSHTMVKMWINMVDIVAAGPMPIKTDKPCWWDRKTFETCPIGAPINYCHDILSSNMKEIVKANISKLNLNCDMENYFETEGIFCSFSCAKAWIMEQSKVDIRYKDSSTLLNQLYYKLYGEIIDISPAPTWKILEKWGGHLSIEEFRNSYCVIQYIITPNIKRPFMFSVGNYVEEIREKS